MKSNRREFLTTTASVLAGTASTSTRLLHPHAARASSTAPDWNAVREDFPWLKEKLWISAANYHPIGIHSLRAIESHYARLVYGPGEGRISFTPERQQETKELFANLIGAKPSEIAFVQGTTDAENLIVAGMDLAHSRGNVVLDDLHYQASKYMYRMLEKKSDLEVRVVPHRHKDGVWRVNTEDMNSAIDHNTRLVSLALVSNINGFLHDVRATSEIAHAKGAYMYADIIQGAGAIPIDVQKLGIDFAGCGAYKWLMSDKGFGFLYVREDLQGSVVQRTRYGTRQFSSPVQAQADSQFRVKPGAIGYFGGSGSSLQNSLGVCTHAALQYIARLGVNNIRSYVHPLTDRLQRELPALGYPSITPIDTPTPVVSFLTPDPEKAKEKLDRAFGYMVVALKRWEFTNPKGDTDVISGVRISPSVYNNHDDLDRLLNALA